MSEQRLTISGDPATGGAGRVPRLELAGYWLEDAGFPVGVEVAVEVVEPGFLVIHRVAEAEAEDQVLLPLVWIPAEQLGRIEAAAATWGTGAQEAARA